MRDGLAECERMQAEDGNNRNRPLRFGMQFPPVTIPKWKFGAKIAEAAPCAQGAVGGSVRQGRTPIMQQDRKNAS